MLRIAGDGMVARVFVHDGRAFKVGDATKIEDERRLMEEIERRWRNHPLNRGNIKVCSVIAFFSSMCDAAAHYLLPDYDLGVLDEDSAVLVTTEVPPLAADVWSRLVPGTSEPGILKLYLGIERTENEAYDEFLRRRIQPSLGWRQAEEVLAMDVEAVSYDFAHYMLHLDAQDIELQVGSGGCTFVLDFSEVKEFTSPASAAKEMARNQKFLPTGALGEEEVGYKLWTKFSRGYEALARAAGVLDKAQKFLAVLCDETRRLRLA